MFPEKKTSLHFSLYFEKRESFVKILSKIRELEILEVSISIRESSKNLNSEMNPLFEVLSTEGKSLLVPVADDLIQSYDTEAQTITMSIPQGLLEI